MGEVQNNDDEKKIEFPVMSEIEKTSNGKSEGGVQNKVTDKRKKIESPDLSKIKRVSNRKLEAGVRREISVKRKKIEDYINYCELCDVKATSSHVWNRNSHINGKRHQQRKFEQTRSIFNNFFQHSFFLFVIVVSNYPT